MTNYVGEQILGQLNSSANKKAWSNLVYNVKVYGALGDGVTDDIAAMRSAATAAANSVLVIPYGNYMLSDQLVISSPMTIWCFGTLKPSTTGTAGKALIRVTSSNVHFYGFGRGMIDGDNKLWCGIQAENDTAVIENITVDNVRFQNIAVNSTIASVFNFVAVKNPTITNNKLFNCGVVGNVAGGGYGIYIAVCQNAIIRGNRLDTVGSSGINVSGGIGNLVEGNTLKKITLFGMKAGYALTEPVSNHVAPTTTTFSIAKTAQSTRGWFLGTAFIIILSNTTHTRGLVKAIADNGTYYTITCTTLSSLPVVGKSIEIPDSGTKWIDNDILYTGDNGFDINVTHEVTIRGNHLKFAGMYRDVGTFAGLHAGIWIGADPQGSVNTLESYGINIQGNTIEHTGGSAIQIFSTHNVVIQGNTCNDYNMDNDANFGGIEVGRLGYYRTTNVTIQNNLCNSVNGFGYGILASFYTNGNISNNLVRSKKGIKINSGVATSVQNNLVESSENSAYGLTITNDSGSNANSGVHISSNNIRCNGTSTTAIQITDVGATVVTITNDNTLSATTKISSSATAKIAKEEYVTLSDTPVRATVEATIAEGNYRKEIAAAANTLIASFIADNGTGGMAEIIGIARDGTTNAEAFRLIAWGGAGASTGVSFTSLGVPRGVAFLASIDFTAVINGSTIEVKYTNNEANPVFISVKVTAISRQ